jgi:hypothetical protein
LSSKVIATVLNLKDNFSETIKKTTQNTNAFAKEVKQAESTITKFKSGITGAFSSTGAKIAGLVGGLGIAKFATDSLMLASDLAEVQNVVDTTFKDSATTINDFAKTTTTQFGISELQAKKFSGTLGAMLKSAGFTGDELTNMSTSLTSLSGDIASFYNLDPEEAFNKLKSGISGETEPLKALGVDISDTTVATYALANGFNKQWKDATQSEKQLWRYKAIMTQTKDAQGDYAKTATGFANLLRTMKLNFQTLGATIMSYAIPSFQELFAKANDFITKIDVKGFIDGMIDKFHQIQPTIDTFIDAFANFAKTIWSDVQPAVEWIKKNIIPKSWDDVKASIEGVLKKATDLVNYINDNWGTIVPIVGSVATAILEWKLALMAVEFWTKAVTIATKAWETISLLIWGIRNATTAWEAAQWALNIAMDANIIGVVILALAALSYAIYEVVIHWKEICEWVGKAWEFLKTNPIASFILDCIPFVNILYEIAKHWTQISDSIKSAWDWLTSWNGTKMEDKKANAYSTQENSQNTNSENAFNSSPWQGGTTSFGMSLGGNATGTNYWKGGRTVVGEHGKEIVDLPGGSKVYTNSQSKGMMNRSNIPPIQVIIQGNVMGNEEYADVIGTHIMNRLRVAEANQ